MTVLTLRTDKPEAELGLYNGTQKLAGTIWHAHRQLAETIHQKIEELLSANNLNIEDIEGIVIFQGPGSFTGLRIGMSVANALAYSNNIPVLAQPGENWLKDGLDKIFSMQPGYWATPHYGGTVNITQPKK